MRQVGETSSGNVIVEMTPLQWEKLEAGISVEAGLLEWYIKQAYDQSQLEPQVADFIIRAGLPGGALARTTFEDFLAMCAMGDQASALHRAGSCPDTAPGLYNEPDR